MQLWQASPSPAPTVPTLTPIAPPIDLTWIYTGMAALGCVIVAGIFLYMLIQNLRGLGSASPWAHVGGLIVAIAGVTVFAIISTNTIWEPFKPLAAGITGPGVVLILVAVAIFAVVNS